MVFFEQLAALTCSKIIVNCTNLVKINSAGLGFFTQLARTFSGQLTLRHVHRNIQSLIEMSGLSHLVLIESDDQKRTRAH